MVNCSIMKACVGKKKIKFEKYVQKVAQKKSHAHSVKNGIGFSVLREVMDSRCSHVRFCREY